MPPSPDALPLTPRVFLILWALDRDDLCGPINAVAPQPVTNLEFTKTLGRVLSRPTILPLPTFAAKAIFGEMADETPLASTRVLPRALEASGYEFRHPTLDEALRHVLGKTVETPSE